MNKLLEIVQNVAGPAVKELYTLEGVPSNDLNDFIIDSNIYSGIYWIGLKAYQFTIAENGFTSAVIN